jgi:Undecaprenyl-phosphate glucose phosphotransferase
MVYHSDFFSRLTATHARPDARAIARPSTPCSIYLSRSRAFQNSIVLVFADIAVLSLATVAMLRQSVDIGALNTVPFALCSVIVLFFAFAAKACGLYDVPALQNLQKGCVSAVETCTITAGGIGVVATMSGGTGALQAGFAVWLAIAASSCLVVRLLYFAVLATFPGFFKERVLLIGAPQSIRELVDELRLKRCEPAQIIGFVSTSAENSSAPVPLLGRLAEMDSLSEVGDCDRIVLVDEGVNSEFFDSIAPKLRATPFEVGIMISTLAQLRVPKSYALSRNNTFQLQSPPLNEVDRFVKRVEDLFLAPILLVLSLPIMLVIAILIRLDGPGPIVFRQKRWGFNGKSFDVYKFRTMIAGAERDPLVAQATQNDPRVTRIGRILRRTSLDELPQFFNVIIGNMSLIGPRPHAVEHNRYYSKAIDGYLARHHVLPGMSGWAQVNGCRGETRTVEAMKRRLDYDLFYIARWSVRLDLYVMLRTIVAVIVGNGAY